MGAVRDLVVPRETGVLVSTSDPETLADGIIGQLSDLPEAERLAHQGRRHVYPRLSVSRLEEDIRGLYRELLLEKGLAVAGSHGSVKRGNG